MADVDTPEVNTPEKAVKAVRPLGVGQAKQLEKLVDNDFAQVKKEIQQHAQEMISDKTETLKSQFHADKAEEYLERARTLAKEYNTNARALIDEARRDGLLLGIPQTTEQTHTDQRHSGYIWVSDERLQNAIQQATQEINESMRNALNTLEKQRLAAMRRVLIASITSDAEKILNDIPTASELMVQAAMERAERKEIATKE